MRKLENLNDLIAEYGSMNELAAFLGYTRHTIGNWKKHGRIPEPSVYVVQHKTAGRFNAERYLANQ